MAASRLLWLALLLASCGKNSPTTPTPTQTRIIRLAGASLNFGTLIVGQSPSPPDGVIFVGNDGTAPLNVSSFTLPCVSAVLQVLGSTAFVVAPQQTLPVTLRFRPTVVQNCTGNVVVNSDATSGGNTIPILANAITPPPPMPASVEYRLTGTARHCAATYQNSTGGTNQQGVSLPFTYGWNNVRIGDFLYMSCQIDQGSDTGTLTVGIYKSGNLYRSGVAIGFPNIATASGSY